MTFELLPFLKELLSQPGLSGSEEPARRVIEKTWQPLVDELQVNRLGSLYGLRKGEGLAPRRKILLAAHMDGIGMMVTQNTGGFLRVTQVGGVDSRILPGQKVTIHGRRDLPAVVVQPPDIHLPPEVRDKPLEMRFLLLDCGLPPQEVAELVRVGDLVSYAQPPLDLAGEVIAGHSLDDRASVASIAVCLERLQKLRHTWDVWAVATCNEEVTFGGAYTSSFEIHPDLAVAIDVTFAKGPGAADYRSVPMGKGAVLGWGANIHPGLFNAMKDLADSYDLPFQVGPMPAHSGTDAFAMQVAAEGIPTMVVSIPLRYMHTPVEVVSLKDITRTGRLLAEFVSALDADFMNNLKWE